MSSYYVDEQTLREVVELVGKTAAAACVSAFLSEVVLKSMVNARPTKIVVEDGIPAALYTIGKNDKPAAVYVSTPESPSIPTWDPYPIHVMECEKRCPKSKNHQGG